MKKISLMLTVAGLFLLATSSIFAQGSGKFPTLDEQITKEYDEFRVQSGTALEQLIRDNQDFGMLRAEEATDKRGLPPWIRVWWRKNHPELDYNGDDPTGGYPLVLKEIVEWMYTHQDLRAGPGVEKDPNVPYLLPKMSTIGTNLRVSGAQTGARSESDIRINYFDTQKIIAGSNNISGTGRQGMYFSTNQGVSWGQNELPFNAGDNSMSDPTIDWTNDGRAYSSTLGVSGNILRLRTYFSADNGATWTIEATPSGAQMAVDKQLHWTDKTATSPFFGRQYIIWHNGAPGFVNRRTAGAAGTWLAAPIQVSGAESTGTAIGSDIRTNSAGEVFGFWPTTGNRRIIMVKSTNGGDTWAPGVVVANTFDGFDIGIPSFNNRRAFIYTSGSAYKTASLNNVYVAWSDLSGDTGCTAAANEPGANAASTCKMRIWFSRSTDGGATWSPATKINNQAGLNDQFNQAMTLDEVDGRLVIIYNDTVGDTTRRTSNIWMQTSTDNGVSWSTAEKITTASTDETIAGADLNNQYGDYNGITGYNGVFFPSWTDRRSLAREEIWTSKITFAAPAPPRSDFDGDGKTDLSVFRGNEGNWYLNRSTTGFAALNFGIATDRITPSDYDGDGKADLSVFRPTATAGVVDFYVLRSSNSTITGVEWGTVGDQPVVADYDGDSRDDYAVWRGSTGTFWVLQSQTGTSRSVALGLSTDKPVSADYNGDGKAEFAVFRPSTGVWFLSDNVTGAITTATFGISTDIPVYADYDGDGKEDIAVFRPSDGNWYTLRSSGGISIIHFGLSGDVPVPGDYDGDGKYDQAVYRNGVWYTNGATSGVAIASFGISTDRPTPRAYLAN
jgi:BNR repeat-like domain/FG-GAP-like repeat